MKRRLIFAAKSAMRKPKVVVIPTAKNTFSGPIIAKKSNVQISEKIKENITAI